MLWTSMRACWTRQMDMSQASVAAHESGSLTWHSPAKSRHCADYPELAYSTLVRQRQPSRACDARRSETAPPLIDATDPADVPGCRTIRKDEPRGNKGYTQNTRFRTARSPSQACSPHVPSHAIPVRQLGLTRQTPALRSRGLSCIRGSGHRLRADHVHQPELERVQHVDGSAVRHPVPCKQVRQHAGRLPQRRGPRDRTYLNDPADLAMLACPQQPRHQRVHFGPDSARRGSLGAR